VIVEASVPRAVRLREMARRNVVFPTLLLPTRQIISPELTKRTILLKTPDRDPRPLRSGSIIAASKTGRRKGTNLLPKIIGAVRFQDGIEFIEVPANHAA
jgi:hypothetical protein